MASPNRKVFCICFRGQGGFFTSFGIDILGGEIRKLGVECEVLNYQDWQTADQLIRQKRAAGYLIALVGYSLGNSTETYLATFEKINLLVAIFESSLGQNYKIIPANVAYSVLYYGQDFLSNAGQEDGFNEKHFVEVTPFTIPIFDHLLGQAERVVIQGTLNLLARLQTEDIH